MVESEFERLEKAVRRMVERFSKLKEERNDLAARLEESEKMIVDLRREVQEFSSQRKEAKQRLDGLIFQLEKLHR